MPHFTLKCSFAICLLGFSLGPLSKTRAQLVTTYAGNIYAGNADDTGVAAAFNWPISVALDKNKNVYVADAENHRIRKISPTGSVSTFAGSLFGNIDSMGTGARFNHPLGVVLNDSGYIFVADSKNNTIRKISPAGAVTTFAGSGAIGSANGTGIAASFNYPNGLAIDAANNIYVADASNNMIRKITPTGTVTTVAGAVTPGNADGADTAARFTYPTGIAVDAGGNLYVADENNHLIRKITPAGMVSTYAGSGNADNIDDTGTAAAFNAPYGLAIDASNNLYVAEIGNNQIRKITAGRQVMSLAGSGNAGSADGLKTDAEFNSPTGVAVDGSGTLFIGDWKNNMIRKIDLTVTGIFTIHAAAQLSVYPNPGHELVTVVAGTGSLLSVYNTIGAKMYEAVASSASSSIAIKNFPAGMYSVVTTARDGKKAFGKFIKD